MNKSDEPKSYYSAFWQRMILLIFCAALWVGIVYFIKAVIRLFGG